MCKDGCSCRNSLRNDPIAKLDGTMTVVAEQLTYMNAYLGLLVDELLEARKMNMSAPADRATLNSLMRPRRRTDEGLS